MARTTWTIEHDDEIGIDYVVVTHDFSDVVHDGILTHTFWIRDDMDIDVQRDMLDDARWEMFGDNATTFDVDKIVNDLKRRRAERNDDDDDETEAR